MSTWEIVGAGAVIFGLVVLIYWLDSKTQINPSRRDKKIDNLIESEVNRPGFGDTYRGGDTSVDN